MTLVDFRQIDTKDFKPKRDLFQILLFVLILVGFVFLKKSCDAHYLENSGKTQGVVISKSGGYNRNSSLEVEFQLEGNTVVSNLITDYDCYKKYNVGDSVEIIYSNDQPEIVEILNCQE